MQLPPHGRWRGINQQLAGLILLWDLVFPLPEEAKGIGCGHFKAQQRVHATLGQLLMAEKRATEFALLESHRPNFTIAFPKLDAHAIGEFIQLWAVTTACAGALLNIDPYDQPAVETGKVATFGLMGRPGYEEWKRKVEGRD